MTGDWREAVKSIIVNRTLGKYDTACSGYGDSYGSFEINDNGESFKVKDRITGESINIIYRFYDEQTNEEMSAYVNKKLDFFK